MMHELLGLSLWLLMHSPPPAAQICRQVKPVVATHRLQLATVSSVIWWMGSTTGN